ncbi:hypothetical protein AK812_SmicGene46501 [Symbiodinium microadriaticum]|uniref:Uncharacterized protein n=1 Tax=Symbiodinium microadriaticum TaxID=2951 RepID=A0A1Q9BTR0_SYMMI|nr:hypothetical protein AK812_SmicGene46501 [Symbiodinium microadriaticum]
MAGGLRLEDWRAGEVEGWRAGGREGWRANGRPIAVDRGKIGSKDRCRSGRDGPDLHSITEFRATKGDSIRHEIVEDNWCDSKGIRVLHEKPWTGCTVFRKAMSTDGVVASKIHSSLNQLQQLSSQGGQIIIYHDVALASSGKPALTTIASWKSFRLKRKVVDTLAAEGVASDLPRLWLKAANGKGGPEMNAMAPSKVATAWRASGATLLAVQ